MTRIAPELLAPAGERACLQAAIDAGADAVYLGSTHFSMRAAARNVAPEQLAESVQRCHDAGVKSYLAVNVTCFQSELAEAARLLDVAVAAGVDAVIAADLGIMTLARERNLVLHASTQLSMANATAIAWLYRSFQIARVVSARECTLPELVAIQQALAAARVPVELEIFVHGAMCVATSGRCFMSERRYGRSANRGACWQPCRREYRITDVQDGHEFLIDQDSVLSPKDLCTLPFLEQLLAAGFVSCKIEGRMRKPEYVHSVVSVYREAIDHWCQSGADVEFQQRKTGWLERLQRVFNRGFGDGFFMGRPIEQWSEGQDNQATHRKMFVGPVTNFYAKPQVAEIQVQSTPIRLGDILLVIGETTGVHEQPIESMQIDGQAVSEAEQGQAVGIASTATVRRKDKAFVLRPG